MASTLRAQTSNDDEYDDPSSELLRELVGELQVDDYVIVERREDASGQTYAQVLRTEDGYLVERRDGSEQTHAHARSSSAQAVHEDLTTWTHAVQRPYTLAWSPGLAK